MRPSGRHRFYAEVMEDLALVVLVLAVFVLLIAFTRGVDRL
jgi:hypothetical protein